MKLHEEWLIKAFHDIESSKLLCKENMDLCDIALYHTQQCAEKSLKAFLVFNNQAIDKTHNLLVLLNACISFDDGFDEIREDALYLNPYSTLYRYPEGDIMPLEAEIQKAIESAERIINYVKVKIAVK